jgi:hypothetical protein
MLSKLVSKPAFLDGVGWPTIGFEAKWRTLRVSFSLRIGLGGRSTEQFRFFYVKGDAGAHLYEKLLIYNLDGSDEVYKMRWSLRYNGVIRQPSVIGRNKWHGVYQ